MDRAPGIEASILLLGFLESGQSSTVTPSFFLHQFGTWKHARRYGGIYAAWALVILLAVLCLGRALYWACMKVSHPVQNFS